MDLFAEIVKRLSADTIFTKSSILEYASESTARKMSKYGVFSGPYLDTFYAVISILKDCGL